MKSYDQKSIHQSHAMQPHSFDQGKQGSIEKILQRFSSPVTITEEDEVARKKSDLDEEELIQPKAENKTGLPHDLKAGVENLSGYSLDDVRVHYNSHKPAQLNALAYAQGTDIHVAPGQEKHLPHEAWHVVQQKQGRVRPTTQMQGMNVNANEGLEKEADVMGNISKHQKMENGKIGINHNTNCIQRLAYTDNSKFTVEDFIKNHADEYSSQTNIKKCAAGFTNHNGRDSGGGTNYSHNGHTIFHYSAGNRNKSNGCTIFFICKEMGPYIANTNNSGQIVAVGRHIDNTGYRLNWVATGVTLGNDNGKTITL